MTRRCAVIIPAYNAARFLGATLESVSAQTFREFDVTVVNDGSSDETGAVARRHPEIRLIEQDNAGVAAARNRGVRETTSEWLAFLDADDLWMPRKLSLQIQCAKESDAGAVFCDLKIIDVDGRDVPQPPSPGASLDMEPLLLHSETIPQGTSSTLLVRRAVFESIGGYDESLATMADWDLLIRLRQTTTFAHVPQELAAYRRYAGTMSRSVAMLERESLLILNKVFGRSDLPPQWRRLEGKSRAWNDLVLSGSHFAARNFKPALRFGLRALRRDPALFGRILNLPVRWAHRLVGVGQ